MLLRNEMGANVRFRRATEADRELAFGIKERAFRPYLEAAGKWDEAKERAGHERRFGEQEFYIIEGDGKDVGVVALTRDGTGFMLHQLMVLPGFQARGYGGSALRHLVNQADSAGLPVRLRVMKSNPRARAFYERFNFAPERETETHVHLLRPPAELPQPSTISLFSPREPTHERSLVAQLLRDRFVVVSGLVSLTLLGIAFWVSAEYLLIYFLCPGAWLSIAVFHVITGRSAASGRLQPGDVVYRWMLPPLAALAVLAAGYAIGASGSGSRAEESFYTGAVFAIALSFWGVVALTCTAFARLGQNV